MRGKKTIAMYVDDHHGDGILGIWCAAPPGVQAQMIDEDPDVFFRPPYVGHRGWIGVRLNHTVTDAELRAILEDVFRVVAPKTLVARLDGADRAVGRRQRGSSTTSGIARSVLVWYSSYDGQTSVARFHHSAFSSPSTTRAR